MNKKRVLLISLESLTIESSNSKLLLSILRSLNFDFDFYQIYSKGYSPNAIDGYYFKISECTLIKKILSPRLNSSFAFKSCNGSNEFEKNYIKKNKIRKNPLTSLIRNKIWDISKRKLIRTIQNINVEFDYILFFDNDIPFFSDFALNINETMGGKLIYITTENYCLKNKNYMTNNNSLIYRKLHNCLFNCRKKMLKKSWKSIFLTDSLRDEFANNFNEMGKSYVLTPISYINEIKVNGDHNKELLTISYCGSFGVGRFETIIDLLHDCEDLSVKFLFAGNLNSEQINLMTTHRNATYLGCVDFNRVLEIYGISDVLLHVESFNEEIKLDSKHAFTGKISDCISSLKPFLYYGPKGNAIYDFLNGNKCAFTAENISEFRNFVYSSLANFSFLNKNRNNALITKEKYFSENSLKQKIGEIFDD